MERTAASAVKSVFHSAREYFNPLLKDSKFKETGVLTPEEFQACGDFLVLKCPSWQWQEGQQEKKREYLSPTKQYLVTRNVPCLERALEMTKFDDEGEQDGFITTGGRGRGYS
jgi:ubiquitin-like-conjugating enzyme ATG3